MSQKDEHNIGNEPEREPAPSEPITEPTPPMPSQDTSDQLRRLAELKESGVISEEDFEQEKRDLESQT